MKTSKRQNKIINSVINSSEPIHLIVSGAGTGKTTLLKNLVKDFKEEFPGCKILFLSFSRRAVFEGRERIEEENVQFETSHSFSFGILKENATKEIELEHISHLGHKSKYTVPIDLNAIDENDTEELLKGVDKESAENVVNYLNKNFKEISWKEPPFKIKSQIDNYLSLKLEHSLVDFNDMLGLARGLLLSNKRLRKKLSSQFQLVCVDEAQDISVQQFDLIKSLFNKNKIVFVGDPCQLAYGFLGAKENIFKHIENYFDKCNTKTYQLDISFRCPQKICELSNSVTSQINFSSKTVLRSYFDKEVNKFPILVKYSGNYSGVDFIVSKVEKILKNKEAEQSIYVLFRSFKGKVSKNAKQLNYLKESLDAKKIAYSCSSFENSNESNLVISTIHSVKGGEADYVFIVDVSSDNIPFKNLSSMKSKKYFNEELSLLNIAITRTKKKLYLLIERDLVGRNNISPFLIKSLEQEILREKTIS